MKLLAKLLHDRRCTKHFYQQQPDSTDQTFEKDHGSLETRKCEVINRLDFLDEKEQWVILGVENSLHWILKVLECSELNCLSSINF